jgi:peptide alpha-N-acetyltransferase
MRRALRKGVPPLFKELKPIFVNDARKLQTIRDLALGYVDNLIKHQRFSTETNEGEEEKEAPTSLLWVYYFIAQYYDYVNDYEQAFAYVNRAMEHTPTLVELYILKGKINKHAGNLYEAVKYLDEAQSLDTADRYINYKCSKYMLRADMLQQALEIAGKFTRESSQPADYLKEMQCMWFETESANTYSRLRKYGEALKKCHQVERHFAEMIEDQFDFHLYCMRKMTLSAYVKMLRVEDVIKSHPFFFRAAQTAIGTYLRLLDSPLTNDEQNKDENVENLSASELKKLKNKQKKQQLKAQQEKDKQMQLEQKKKEMNKPKKEDGGENDAVNEEELVPEKLERVKLKFIY